MRPRLPWTAIPLFALLGCQTAFGGVSLRPSFLSIPLAALLAQRYGRRGLLTVAIGLGLSLYIVNAGWPWVDYSPRYEDYFVKYYFERRPFWPVLPLSLRSYAGTFVNELAVHGIAFVVALHLARPRPFVPAIRLEAMPTAVVVAAVALFPIALTLYREDMGGGLVVFSPVNLLPLLYSSLITFGLCNVKPALVIGALALATATGLSFELLGVAGPLSRAFAIATDLGPRFFEDVRYRLNAPVDLFMGIACFAVGRQLRSLPFHQGHAEARPRGAVVLLAALLALWVGGLAYELVPSNTGTATFHMLRLAGDIHALPVLALFAGAVFGARGVALVVAASLMLPFSKLVLAQFGVVQTPIIPLEEPFYGLAFGAMGTALRDRSAAVQRVWHPLHWMAYLAVLIVAVPQVYGFDSPAAIVCAAATVMGLMAAALLFGWLLQRAAGTRSDAGSGGWVALAALAGLFFSLGPQVKDAAVALVASGASGGTLIDALAQMNAEDGPDGPLWRLLVVLAWLSAVFALLKQFLASLPKIADDVRGLVDWCRQFSRWTPSTAKPSEKDASEKAPWRRFVDRGVRVVSWSRNVAIAFLIGTIALLAQRLSF